MHNLSDYINKYRGQFKKEIMLCFHLRRDLRHYIIHLIFCSLRTCMLNRMFFHQTIVSQLSHYQHHSNPTEMLAAKPYKY